MLMSGTNVWPKVNDAVVERPDCVVIVGHGRSGTNWLLGLFDLSADTFCRNEPDRSEGTPFSEMMHDRTICRLNQSELHLKWDRAVYWCSTHRGRVDQRVVVRKDYVRPIARALGLWRIVQGPRFRRLLGAVTRSLRSEEWVPPGWVCDPERLRRALPVLKLVQAPGWASFVLRHRPRTQVFHIVRHPGGFLNSWSNRYRSKHEESEVREKNHSRLRAIVAEDPMWGERFCDISAMSTEESELWYWCYASETIHKAGQACNHYNLINYELLAHDPISCMRKCYFECGLGWADQIEHEVRAKGAESGSIARGWRSVLRAEQVALVERVLDQTLMRAWWNETGDAVSLAK